MSVPADSLAPLDTRTSQAQGWPCLRPSVYVGLAVALLTAHRKFQIVSKFGKLRLLHKVFAYT